MKAEDQVTLKNNIIIHVGGGTEFTVMRGSVGKVLETNEQMRKVRFQIKHLEIYMTTWVSEKDLK